MRGYFGIGIYHVKTETNIGTLWRSAYQFGASYIFTIGKRYKRQSSDTLKAWRHIPLFHYADYDEFRSGIPFNCLVIGVEIGGSDIASFKHPERCIYLLGAEDHGIPASLTAKCNKVITIPAITTNSYNVAVAGSIVMYDRMIKCALTPTS